MIPVVTVVLPVYNGANYLRESIQSVLSQTFTDFELHVLDDGSNDETSTIAQSTNDPRVKYSRNPGRFGLFKTLNRGFEETSSPLVRIWAHDDRMLPNSLERFVAFWHEHPEAGMVYCDFRAIDEAGRPTGTDKNYLDQRERTPDLADSAYSALLFFYYGCLPGNVSTVIMRRQAWKECGEFITGMQQAPDYEMWTRVSEHYLIGFLREKLIELREHPLQLSRQGFRDMTIIEEEFDIIRHLRCRLADLVPDRDFDYSWRCERGRQHVHWVARALLRGDLRHAARGWRAIKRYGQPWSQVLSWFFSANGRFFMPDRAQLVDEKLKRLRND